MDTPTILRERKRWGATRCFILISESLFLNDKIRTYLIRYLRRRHPHLNVIPPDAPLPSPHGSLIPMKYFVIREANRLSAREIQQLSSPSERHDAPIWCINGFPQWEQSVWETLRSSTLIYHESLPDPSGAVDWIIRLGRSFGLKIDRSAASAFATAVLYDPVPIITALENLALAEVPQPVRWADIEPYLPEYARNFTGTLIFQWLEKKEYEKILQVIHTLINQKPDTGILLRQGYEVWRRWVLDEWIQDKDYQMISKKWRYTPPDRNANAIRLTPLQLRTWAQLASELEQKIRMGDVDPSSMLTLVMFRWLRIIA